MTARENARMPLHDGHYADLIAGLNGIVWEADARTCQMTYVSDAAVRMLGYPIADWLQHDFWQRKVHPDDSEEVIELCKAAAAEPQVHTLEYRMIAADGRVVWLRDLITVVAHAGRPRTLRGIMIDITDERRAHEERLEHIHYLEVLDRVNRAIQVALDLDAMMRDVLDVTLAAFACDRAWLGQPCDPDGGRWFCEMERTRPEYPGAGSRGEPVPIVGGGARHLPCRQCRRDPGCLRPWGAAARAGVPGRRLPGAGGARHDRAPARGAAVHVRAAPVQSRPQLDACRAAPVRGDRPAPR